MKNNIVTSLIFLISFSSLYGQENSDSYWESLLMNDREAALSGVDEAYKKNKPYTPNVNGNT